MRANRSGTKSCSSDGRCRAAAGFTLIELLVVIGIISVLIAMLIPTFNRAREQARTTLCLSNLKQIGIAAATYAETYDQYVVPVGYRGCMVGINGATVSTTPTAATDGSNYYYNIENWASLLVYMGGVTAPTEAADTPSSSTGDRGAPSSSNDVTTGSTGSVLHCPSGVDDYFIYDEYANEQGYLGFGGTMKPGTRLDSAGASGWRVKSALNNGKLIDTWYGVNGDTWPWTSDMALPTRRLPYDNAGAGDWRLHKRNELKHPAQLVFLYDGLYFNMFSNNSWLLNARHGTMSDNQDPAYDQKWPKSYDTQGMRTNLLFYDGHAESVDTKTIPPYGDLNTLNQFGTTILWRNDQIP